MTSFWTDCHQFLVRRLKTRKTRTEKETHFINKLPREMLLRLTEYPNIMESPDRTDSSGWLMTYSLIKYLFLASNEVNARIAFNFCRENIGDGKCAGAS